MSIARHTLSLKLLRRALRVKVCARCPRRPPASESWASDQIRGCEGDCPIFLHLPQIKTVAEQVDTMVASRKRILRGLLNEIREIHRQHQGPGRSRGRPLPDTPTVRRVVEAVDGLMGV